MTNWDAIGKSWAILPKVGGLFSIVGSCLVLRDVAKQWKTIPLTTEVISHITVANLLIAIFESFLSTWMVPKKNAPPHTFWAAGNVATCNVQGFIAVFMFIVLEISYTILCVLYWIMVAYGWSDEHTKRKSVRFIFLGLPVIAGLGFAVPLLCLGYFNYTGAYSCFINEYPLHCEDVGSDVPCTRAADARIWQGSLFLGVFLCTFIIIVSFSLLVNNVLQQERKNDRYSFTGEMRRDMTRKAFWQSIRYFLVFFVSNIPFYVYGIYDMTETYAPIEATFLYVILWPMFGAFNSFVYFRPRYLSHREKNKDKPWVHSLFASLHMEVKWSTKPRERNAPLPPPLEDNDLESPLFCESIP